jgi:ABC-2 type transport system ATP-binding protein
MGIRPVKRADSAVAVRDRAVISIKLARERTMSDCERVIDVDSLVVEYGRGSRAAQAVRGLSFAVERGQTVGFIGPNGAGKSSTIKTLMGFIFPRDGRVRIFGEPAGTVASRRRIGYLPEVSLYYPFMKAREVLELYGGLAGLGRGELRRRIPELLERVGLAGKGEILLKHFSKGMQQRVGIAQAIIADPDLFIFDELSSGLDPVGRHDLRAVLLDLKARGRTIFFSSHELHEVEALCDRVLIIHSGRKMAEETVADLMGKLAGGNGSDRPVSLEQYFMGLIRPSQAAAA